MSPRTLGEHLRLARIDRNLTQAQVASVLGVAYQTVVKWEHNVAGISAERRAAIIGFIGYAPCCDSAESNRRPK